MEKTNKPDWLDELNQHLSMNGIRKRDLLPFADFVLVEEDWAEGKSADAVADEILAGTHPRVPLPVTA